MSLINAETLMTNLHDGIFGDSELKADYELLGIDDYIKNQPTAYDVDFVIQCLESAKEAWEDYEHILDKRIAEEKVKTLDYAIRVVKQGGIDDRD